MMLLVMKNSAQWDVTEEKHDDNTDKDAGKIHLVVGTTAVAVGLNMGLQNES